MLFNSFNLHSISFLSLNIEHKHVFEAVLCYVFLGTPLTMASITAGVLVIIATTLYYNYESLLQTDTMFCNKVCQLCSFTPAGYQPVDTSDKYITSPPSKDRDANA